MTMYSTTLCFLSYRFWMTRPEEMGKLLRRKKTTRRQKQGASSHSNWQSLTRSLARSSSPAQRNEGPIRSDTTIMCLKIISGLNYLIQCTITPIVCSFFGWYNSSFQRSGGICFWQKYTVTFPGCTLLLWGCCHDQTSLKIECMDKSKTYGITLDLNLDMSWSTFLEEYFMLWSMMVGTEHINAAEHAGINLTQTQTLTWITHFKQHRRLRCCVWLNWKPADCWVTDHWYPLFKSHLTAAEPGEDHVFVNSGVHFPSTTMPLQWRCGATGCSQDPLCWQCGRKKRGRWGMGGW